MENAYRQYTSFKGQLSAQSYSIPKESFVGPCQSGDPDLQSSPVRRNSTTIHAPVRKRRNTILADMCTGKKRWVCGLMRVVMLKTQP